ncbi:MAG: beta strand repeat-containing protein, partial [Sphingorhabdus sp.]
SMAITGGATLSGTGINMNGDGITGMAVGALTATSTDAVNGSQINTLGTSIAANFGGTSVFNPATGTVTAPAYTVQGSTYNNVGDALGGVNTALTNLTTGTTGLVQQVGGAPGSGLITVGAATAGTTVSFAGTSGNRVLTDVAPGAVTATSDDAINGSQLNKGLASVADGLGGGSVFDPVTGEVTNPTYNVGGGSFNNVGDALTALDGDLKYVDFNSTLANADASGPNSTAIGPNAQAAGNNASAFGVNSDASGNNALASGSGASAVANNSTALGANTSANGVNSVALGTNSQAGNANAGWTGYTVAGQTMTNNVTGNGVVSISGGSTNRQLTGVADGAVNATSTDAINGSQLFNTAAALDTKATNIGAGLASAIGGGAAVGPNGTVTPPSVNIGGTTYNNLTDAIQAAGAGWNFTTAAVGTGTMAGTSVAQVSGGETVTIAAGNNLVGTQTGNGVELALNPVLTGITSLTITGGPVLDGNGIAMNGDKITGMAAGAVTSGSTDAVNGDQIFDLGTSVATNLGGGSTFDPVTGTVTAPSYTVQGSTYNNVGDAFGGVNNALTNLANGTTGLVQQVGGAPGTGQITMGAATGGTSISFAGADGNRVLTDVKAGALTATSDDAVNGSQINTGLTSVANGLGGGSTFDPVTGQVTAPTYNVAGGTQNNVGDALGALNTANNTANTSIANVIGGGMAVGPNGTVTPPSFTVNGNTYNNVAAAVQAAGAGFNLTTAQTGSGVANGTTVEAVGAGETATVTAGNNIVTTQVGNEVQVAVNSNLTGMDSITINGGPVINGNGINMNGDTITNLGAGSTAPGSTDAINGGQFNTGLVSVANNLGGGATYNSVTNTITAPIYNIAGSTYNNVGDAFGGVNNILTNITNGTTGLVQQVGGAPGTGQITVGAATGGTSVNMAGTAGDRIVTGVAAGSLTPTSTDAVNGSQINILAGSAATAIGGGSTFNPVTGALTAPSISVGGNTYNNITAAIQAGDDKADEGLADIANALGGGATYNPATGSISSPSYALGGNTYNSVGGALTALANGGVGPVQYSNVATPTTANGGTPTNSLTLVGATTGPVTLNNVANAALTPTSNQAVNGSQLNTGLSSVASGLGGGSTFNPATGTVSNPTYNVQGGTQNSVGGALTALNNAVNNVANGTTGLVQQTGGAPGTGQLTVGAATGGTSVSFTGTAGNRTLTGVAAGAVNATSTEAVNGSQLHALQQTVAAGNSQTQNIVNGMGNGVAAGLGGGAAYNPSTGQMTAPTYNVGGQTYNNVGDALTATNRGGVQYVRDANGNPTNAVQLSGADNGQPVAVRNVAAGAVAANSTDAVNGGQLYAVQQTVQQTSAGAVQYDRNTDGSIYRGAVSFGTPGTPVQLRNVAPAVVATDAVNLGQMQSALASNLSSANAYTDAKINDLNFDLRNVAKRSYAGTASAIALQAPALFDPGTVSMRGGVGYYRGEWALGLGLRATADNGRWSVSGGVSGGPNAGVAASAGIDILIGD